MKYLIVSSHPLKESLCENLTTFIRNKLIEAGHEVEVEDLYASNFNPALTIKERETYYLSDYYSSGVIKQTQQLTEAEALILIFPTWWFGFPAILKGWFDRVWVPGIAYDHASDLSAIKPRLDKLQKVIVVTTLGSPWWVDKFLIRQPVKRIIKHAILGTCTKKSTLHFLSLYQSEKLDERKIEAFKKKINNVLQKS